MPPPPRLLQYDRLDELWEGSLRVWFSARRGLPVPGAPPAVVVAPDEVRLGWLKRSWLAHGGGPLFGVQFWTPGLLRRHLLEKLLEGPRLATAEDLALAVRLVLQEERPDSPLGVVAQDPTGFLAAWDAWMAGGGGTDLIAEPWRGLPERLAAHLRVLGLISVREADRRLAALPGSAAPVLGPILLDGFTPLQAALFPLLQAALRQAPAGQLTLALPRDRTLERVWVGTFERAFETPAELATGAGDAGLFPFADWAHRAEEGWVGSGRPEGCAFHLYASRGDEAAAIVGRVAELMAAHPGARIGVVLPNEPLLCRRVASALVPTGIPFHDAFGHFPSPAGAERVFAAWVAFQRTGRVAEADVLLEESVDLGATEASTAAAVREAWRSARERTLSDDLGVLVAFLTAASGTRGAEAAVEWAARWPRLRAQGRMAEFLEEAVPAFASWGGEEEFARAREGWAGNWGRWDGLVDRGLFLEWLWGSMRRPGRARHPAARDAFAPVQVVAYEMVRSAHWDFLLLAGMNERLVPAVSRESAFLVPGAAARHLGREVVEGSQGEGHEALRPGRGFLLEDADRRALQAGALFDAIAETRLGVELFATYAPEGGDREATVLSDYFQRLFRSAEGASAKLPCPGQARLPVPEAIAAGADEQALPLGSTGAAFGRRFDRTQPFDAYSFGFRTPPAEPLALGAREWEDTLQRPATVWLRAIARLRPREDFAEPVSLPLLRGLAAHRLLRPPGGETWHRVGGEGSSLQGGALEQALRWRRSVEQAHAAAGRTVSLLWFEQWGIVRGLVRRFARLVESHGALPWLAGEYSLPEGSRWTLAEGGALHLRGRVDALLVDDPDRPREAFVVDFKTGGDDALKATGVQQGRGLQLVLYGGALADQWQCPVHLGLLKPDSPELVSQISMTVGEDPSGLLPGLVSIGLRGVLGFAGEVRSDFAYVGDYPLAFVPPPAEIVVEKWLRTHPDLPLPKGGTA